MTGGPAPGHEDVCGQLGPEEVRRVAVHGPVEPHGIAGGGHDVGHDLRGVAVYVPGVGKALYLSDADDIGIAQKVLDVLRGYVDPRGLQSGTVGRQARHHQIDVVRNPARLVRHGLHAHRPQGVADLVRIGDQRRRPRGDREPGKLRNRQHTALEVHVGIDESRGQVAPLQVDIGRIRPDQLTAISDHENVASLDGYVPDVGLAGQRVDDCPARQHQIGVPVLGHQHVYHGTVFHGPLHGINPAQEHLPPPKTDARAVSCRSCRWYPQSRR